MGYFFNFDKMGYLKGKKPDRCILCLVRDGSSEVDSLVVHRVPNFIVSLNLYPYNPGHILVFPASHVEDIRDLSRELRQEMDDLVTLCLEVLDETQAPSGYNIGFNMGLSAGASIEHLHLHIIPRYPRELGIAELIAGKRVLVQDPLATQATMAAAFARLSAAAAKER